MTMTTTTKQQKQFNYSDEKLTRPDAPYIADDTLTQAVNLAIYLKRPLLLQGEPGTGKTQLAKAIARQFGQDKNIVKKPLDQEKYPLNYPYYEWHIKSISRAQEGLYSYDSVGRLRDVQLIRDIDTIFLDKDKRQELLARIQDPEKYIKYGPLGHAFQEELYRPVVLIDEIDKADIDFPNDLLRELDQSKFTVTETGTTISAKQTPIMIITSNQERDLPDAFLRRCIFYYIQFPDDQQLIKIAQAHFQSLNSDLMTQAVAKFFHIRTQGIKRKDGKKPGTSEFLDLIQFLQQYPPKKAIELVNTIANHQDLLGILLKNQTDQDAYRKLFEETSNE